MNGKYKYVFRFGRGSKSAEIFGPSIAYFWNDIYDLFDLHRELFVEKLDRTPFTVNEIKRLFKDLEEDMNEDYAEIWLDIQRNGMRLRFIEINILPGISLEEQQTLFEECKMEDKGTEVLSNNEIRLIHYPISNVLVLFVNTERSEETDEHLAVDTGKVQLLLEQGRLKNADERILVTWNEICTEAKAFAKKSKIELLDSDSMLKELNSRNLEIALVELNTNVSRKTTEKFTKEKFKIYLSFVKSARSNITKKESLEKLSQYFFNGVTGLKVKQTDLRGPSEELDIILANESLLPPFQILGNPIAVECRHRNKSADSKAVRDFYGKLLAIGLKTGILVTLKGITGNVYDAVGVIRDARKNGVSIIVVTLNDLEEAANGKKPIEIIKDCFYRYV